MTLPNIRDTKKHLTFCAENVDLKMLQKDKMLQILGIQQQCFIPEYQECALVYEAIIDRFPQGVWGCFLNAKLNAYIFFHPYKEGFVKPLNSTLHLDGDENCMYLHEIAVLPIYKGKGFSKLLLTKFDEITIASKYQRQSLVSVQNSIGFWQRNGFDVVKEINESGYFDSFLMSKRFLF